MITTIKNRQRYRTNLEKSFKIACINLVAFLILFVVELLIAVTSDSKALLAASFNNLSSVLIAIGIILGQLLSLKSPSHSHPKGYQKMETVTNLLSSLFMLVMSAYIFITGGRDLIYTFKEATVDDSLLPVFVAIGAGIFMLVIYFYNKTNYQKIGSSGLFTLMKDTLSDSIMNLGTAVGIFLAVKINPVFDSLTALFLGLVLCYMSYDVVRNNVFHLSGGFSPSMISNYYNVIEEVAGVEKIIDITGTKYGDAIVVDVVVEVSGEKSVLEGSLIADKIEEELTLRFDDIFDVDIQVKPKRVLRN
ncbi:MAG: cation diffusion facilitator family transporter [Lachnospirales bacterium]